MCAVLVTSFFSFSLMQTLFNGAVYKKHYPPALRDDVWRLEKIGKDGAFHKKLSAAGIVTVEDFLRIMVRDSGGLRAVSALFMSSLSRSQG